MKFAMNRIFSLTVIFAFLAIFVESLTLMLQLNGRKLTKLFGKNAFNFHMTTTGAFWVMGFCLMVILQFEDHPLFSTNVSLKYVGSILLISGLILVYWSLRLLGLKRALCLNFFQQNVPVVRKSLYKYIKNPLDYGIWLARKGFKIGFGKSILDKGTASMFLFGFLMGIATCVPYVAVLIYIACVAENAVLAGVLYAAVFAVGTAIAPIVLGTLMGIIPGELFKSAKWLRAFNLICGVVLILFGFQLIYYVLILVI